MKTLWRRPVAFAASAIALNDIAMRKNELACTREREKGRTKKHERKTKEIEQGQGGEYDCCVEAVAGERVGDKGKDGCEGRKRERDGVVRRSEEED